MPRPPGGEDILFEVADVATLASRDPPGTICMNHPTGATARSGPRAPLDELYATIATSWTGCAVERGHSVGNLCLRVPFGASTKSPTVCGTARSKRACWFTGCSRVGARRFGTEAHPAHPGFRARPRGGGPSREAWEPFSSMKTLHSIQEAHLPLDVRSAGTV